MLYSQVSRHDCDNNILESGASPDSRIVLPFRRGLTNQEIHEAFFSYKKLQYIRRQTYLLFVST